MGKDCTSDHSAPGDARGVNVYQSDILEGASEVPCNAAGLFAVLVCNDLSSSVGAGGKKAFGGVIDAVCNGREGDEGFVQEVWVPWFPALVALLVFSR